MKKTRLFCFRRKRGPEIFSCQPAFILQSNPGYLEMKFTVGSRKSRLALTQTESVVDALKRYHNKNGQTGIEIDVLTMSTTGDHILDQPLHEIGSKSLFTKELEVSLIEEKVDFVVHSLKDLPTTLPDGLCIGAVLEREDPSDALVIGDKMDTIQYIEDLPDGSIIGTSSIRRLAQLRYHYPNLKTKDIRGNLDTRLSKLNKVPEINAGKKDFDAIVLAVAGLKRLGYESKISVYLNSETKVVKMNQDNTSDTVNKPFFHAVGQGALAIECRSKDKQIIDILKPIHHIPTFYCISAEREMLKVLEGGCSVPIGVVSKWINADTNELELTGLVSSVDGKARILESKSMLINSEQDAVKLGRHVANLLIEKGAMKILGKDS